MPDEIPASPILQADSQKPEFKAAVGMSRKLNAREAGREVAQDTIANR